MEESDKGQCLHADSAYTGKKQEKVIKKYKLKNKVHEKGYRGNPLTEKQKAKNKLKSKIRARVEHVFGFMEQSMNGLALKSVGIARATGIIGLINLTYNMFRYEQVQRLNLFCYCTSETPLKVAFTKKARNKPIIIVLNTVFCSNFTFKSGVIPYLLS